LIFQTTVYVVNHLHDTPTIGRNSVLWSINMR